MLNDFRRKHVILINYDVSHYTLRGVEKSAINDGK
ncbi:Hypothetical protein Y17_2756 [Pectobacterium wasabiae CFBP 3304]|nr:Hypothetical protein Y17_2756 [Pectobacterium wasabiae CFBP 3304]